MIDDDVLYFLMEEEKEDEELLKNQIGSQYGSLSYLWENIALNGDIFNENRFMEAY